MMKTTTQFHWARAAMMLLLVLLASMTVRAHEQQVIVWLSDGTKSAAPFSTMPEFTYADGYVKMKSTKTEQSWSIEKLSKLTFIKKGDVNEDGAVDQKDIQEVKDYIMASPSAMDDKSKLDVNGDNQVNVADIVEITNIIQSVVTSAQSIIVVDKNGNKTSFDPAEVESVEFWNNPPSIIVNKYADTRQFTFDKIRSVTGLPNYLLVHPDTVYVSAGGGKCDFEVRSNVAFDATPSDKWISYESKSGAQQTLTAAGNDSKARVGYIALVSKDQQLKDTLWVVQAGKAESDFNYIYFYNLKCVTPDQEICVGFISNGSNSNFPGDVSTAARGYKSRFQITHYEDGKWQPVKEQMINFEPEKGSCDPTTVYTNASGEVETTFFPNNIWIGEGNVKASSSLTFDSGESWTGYATANYSFIDIYNLDNISSQKEVIRGETGIANFKLTKFVNGGWVPCVGQEIEVNFENCSFGGAKTLKASTDAAGEVTFTFSPDNNISVTECSITATCPVKLKNGRTATGVSKATFKISEKYKIECDDKGSIYCSKDGNRVLRFLLLEHSPEHGWIASQKAPACTFGATNGTVDQNGKFNDFGIVLATFTPTGSFSPTDPGSLTVRTSITYPDGGVWNGECSVTILYEDGYRLECLTPEKIVEPAKTEACEFRLLKKENDNWVPAEGKEISIFVDKALSHHKTDAEGKVSVDFYQNALADEVEISASFAFMDGTGYHTGQTSTKFYLARYRMLPNMLEAHIDGKQPFDFISFHLDEWVDPGLWFPCEGKKITFEATGGTVTPNSDVTAKDGYVYVNFKPEKNFQGGTVTGKCEIALPSGKIWQSEWTVKLIQEDLIQLKCLSPEQYIAPGEEKTCEFQLMHRESPNAAWEVYPNQEIVATPVNGKLNPHIWPTTDAEGKVSLNYKMDADKFEGSVEAKYQEIINGIIYCIQTKADYFSAPYKLMANVEKMYIDGHDTYNLVFYLQEYVDGQWQTCETEHEIKVEATGGTFKKVDQLGLAKPGYISINFTPEDNFKEGSVTVKSEIMLEDGRVWKGEVTTVLLLEEDCKLECLTEDLTVAYGEDKRIEFLLTQKVDDEWVPCADKTIEFSATNGSVTPYNSNKTQADGKTFTKFTLDKDKTQGTVHAKYLYRDQDHIYHYVRTDVDLSLQKYNLECLTPDVEIKKGESADIRFRLLEFNSDKNEWVPCPNKKITFTAENGSCTPDWMETNDEGIAQAKFTPAADATQGTLTGSCTIVLDEKTHLSWSQSKTAHITIIDDGGSSAPCDTGDELLNKADLMDNSYVIKNKKTGEEQVRDYAPKWSEWRKEGKDFIMFQLEDADADGMTLGDAWGYLPWNIVNVVTALTGQSFENSPGGKFGFGVYTDECNLNAHFGAHTGESGMATEGNLKPESKILIRKPCNKTIPVNNARRATGEEDEYTGEYELLFYLVFENDGDEYEIYGKGTMKMHVPTITSMQLSSEAQYLKVGESTKVNVDGYYEEGAQWDWNDVQISGQSADYSAAYDGADEGYFTWDPATQTLTSVKPNDNKPVYVIFSLKSRPSCQSAITISTGEGWKYTMIKVGPEEQEVNPGYYCRYYIEDWAPRDSEDEKFDDSAIEIDPASDPEGNFRYVHYNGKYDARLYVYRSDAAPGEYNLHFRLKSNHSVGSTMKIIIKPREE